MAQLLIIVMALMQNIIASESVVLVKNVFDSRKVPPVNNTISGSRAHLVLVAFVSIGLTFWSLSSSQHYHMTISPSAVQLIAQPCPPIPAESFF